MPSWSRSRSDIAYARIPSKQLARLATALFGGLTPLLSTWLIETTGDKASPGYWMAAAGAISLLATFLVYRGIVKVREMPASRT